MKNEDKIKELEERIKKLEDSRVLPVYQPYIMPNQTLSPNLHWHGGQPCYQYPCVWC